MKCIYLFSKEALDNDLNLTHVSDSDVITSPNKFAKSLKDLTGESNGIIPIKLQSAVLDASNLNLLKDIIKDNTPTMFVIDSSIIDRSNQLIKIINSILAERSENSLSFNMPFSICFYEDQEFYSCDLKTVKEMGDSKISFVDGVRGNPLNKEDFQDYIKLINKSNLFYRLWILLLIACIALIVLAIAMPHIGLIGIVLYVCIAATLFLAVYLRYRCPQIREKADEKNMALMGTSYGLRKKLIISDKLSCVQQSSNDDLNKNETYYSQLMHYKQASFLTKNSSANLVKDANYSQAKKLLNETLQTIKEVDNEDDNNNNVF